MWGGKWRKGGGHQNSGFNRVKLNLYGLFRKLKHL